jgi:hypothetical protein
MEKQSLAIVGAILAMGLVASVQSLVAWTMTVIVAFGSSVLLRHSWSQLMSTASWRYQGERSVRCASALRQRGAGATTLVRAEWRRRRHPRELGWMGERWLAEHRATDR